MSDSLLHRALQDNSCLACGYHWSVPLFDGGQQPLATLAWPRNAQDSQNLPQYALSFLRCLHCGHIYNKDFQYHDVPYAKLPNLMYNRSQIWQSHLQHIARKLQGFLPSSPTIVEIGCGEGDFLNLLSQIFQDGRFIGFDPNGTGHNKHPHLQLRQELFVPATHLKEVQPDLILSRHVLEHLIDPLAFIQNLALFSSYYQQQPHLFFEVPCVDRLLENGRLEDLYYEHNSHFTTRSFSTMLNHLDCKIKFIEKGYNNEVIFGLLQVNAWPQLAQTLVETENFHALAQSAQTQVPRQFEELLQTAHPVIVWGGTGKGAAFIHHFKLVQFSSQYQVVDSDPAKVGTFVPGTNLCIHPREILLKHPPAHIVITAQWRAEDIRLEIQNHQIPYQQILIEHRGELINFETTEHPYHPNSREIRDE